MAYVPLNGLLVSATEQVPMMTLTRLVVLVLMRTMKFWQEPEYVASMRILFTFVGMSKTLSPTPDLMNSGELSIPNPDTLIAGLPPV